MRLKFLKKNWEIATLCLMTGYDASLHIVEIFQVWKYHPLYPMFPLMNFISYDLFWTCYWSFAFLLTIKFLVKLARRK
jgi:hypothetical protein